MAEPEMIIVDTNVLLDVLSGDAQWSEWSRMQLEACAARDRLCINAVIYAELSVGYERIEDLEDVVTTAGLVISDIPRPALFLAGKAFRAYRANRGAKTGVLPDFFIGAHAAVERATLLTRDAIRYRTYFPTLNLLAPA